MAGSDASEGQAVWQPGGAEEDSRLREGNRHLHLAYDDDEEEDISYDVSHRRCLTHICIVRKGLISWCVAYGGGWVEGDVGDGGVVCLVE